MDRECNRQTSTLVFPYLLLRNRSLFLLSNCFWLRKFVGWSKDFAIIVNFFSKIRVKVIIIRKDNIIHFTKSK